MLEYYEDIWEKEPARARQMLGKFEDDIVFETGDAEVDEIERRLAAGEDPDKVLEGWGDGLGEDAEPEAEPESFDDNYEDLGPEGLSWAKQE